MFVNSMPRNEILSEDAMGVLDRGWRRIVSEFGIEFLLPEAVELLRSAGQTVEDKNRVRFDPDFHGAVQPASLAARADREAVNAALDHCEAPAAKAVLARAAARGVGHARRSSGV